MVMTAGGLGSRRPVVAGIGLAVVAFCCVGLAATRPPEVVAAIEAAEGPAVDGSATTGGPLPPGVTAAPSAAKAKPAFATPDELDAADSLEKMVALGEKYPDDPAVVKRLAIAHSGKSDHSGAIRAVR